MSIPSQSSKTHASVPQKLGVGDLHRAFERPARTLDIALNLQR